MEVRYMKKHKNHNLEELSEHALKSITIDNNWIARKKEYDYGYDYEIQFVDSEDNVTEKVIWVQLKATNNTFQNEEVKLSGFNIDNLLDYEKSWLPVLIMYWVEPSKKFYYLFAQKYIREVLDVKKPEWRNNKTVTLSGFTELVSHSELDEFSTEGYIYLIHNRLGIKNPSNTTYYWSDGVFTSDSEIVKEKALEVFILIRKYKFDEALKLLKNIQLKYSLSLRERLSMNSFEGLIHMQTQKYREAYELYTNVVELLNVEDSEEFKVAKAIMLTNLGVMNRLAGRNDEARNNFVEAMEIAKNEIEIDLLGDINNNIGILYKNLMQYDKALECYLEAEKCYIESKNKYYEAVVLGNIGVLYRRLKKYDHALEYARKSININEETKNLNSLADQYGNIGLVYNELSEFSDADKYYKRALSIKEKIKDKKGIGLCIGNIGVNYMDWKNNGEAEVCLLESIAVFREINYKHGEGEMLYNLGLNYYESDDKTNAQKYMFLSLELFNNINNESVKVMIRNKMIELELS